VLMEESLRKIVATIAECKAGFPVTAHLRDELGVDSVRALEIIFEIEKEFKISVPEERYGEIRTFSDLVSLVKDIKG